MTDRVEEILCQYLDIEPNLAPLVHDRLAKYAFGDDPYLYDEIHDIATLEKIERCVRDLVRLLDVDSMTQSAHDTLAMTVLRGPHQRRVNDGLLYADAEMQEYLQETGKPASEVLYRFRENSLAILFAVAETKRQLQKSDRKRKALSKMNLRGIQLVSAARDIWRQYTGKSAPAKALNPASKFGFFLSELFDAFQVGGDPKAAFRAWAKNAEEAEK